jgi:hypothetical protein
MRVKFNEEILDFKGLPIKDGEGTLTLGAVCVSSLMTPVQEDQNNPKAQEDNVRRFKIALAIESGEEDISENDLDVIKKRLAHVFNLRQFGALIIGRTLPMLEMPKPALVDKSA